MDLKGKTGWIFDLDGTLTQPVHDFAYIREVLGIRPEEDILATIATKPEQVRRPMTEQLDELERHFAALAKPADSVLECLTLLKNRNCSLGILTRNTKEMALLSLQAIGAAEYFSLENILGREEIQPKPAPDGINFLLNQWGMDSSSAVMVGDYHFDLLSGRAAGVCTVHVDKQDRNWPEDTDVRVRTLSELVSLFS